MKTDLHRVTFYNRPPRASGRVGLFYSAEIEHDEGRQETETRSLFQRCHVFVADEGVIGIGPEDEVGLEGFAGGP